MKIISKINSFLFQALSFKYFIAFAVVITFIYEFRYLNRSPENDHLWRQCNTLAVARNFFEEDMNIMNLRVDNRYEQTGVTGGHFPVYEWILALFYHITGEQYWVGRLWSFILLALGAWALFLWTRHVTKSTTVANISAWFFLLSPVMVYYGISALPDILAISASLGGMYLVWKWLDKEAKNNVITLELVFGFLLLVLAGLTKIQYLAVGFPIAVKVLLDYQNYIRPKTLTAIGILALGCVTIPVAWYIRARNLIATTYLTDFGIEFRPETDPEKIKEILQVNYSHYFPHLLLGQSGWVLVFAFIGIGIFFHFSKKWKNRLNILPIWQTNFGISLWVWFAILIAYFVIELGQMRYHDYYLIPFMPFICLLAGLGAKRLVEIKAPVIIIGLLITSLYTAHKYTIIERRNPEGKNVKPEFLNPETLKKLQDAIPAGQKVIMGPDESKCIFFYYLRKKGMAYAPYDDLTKPSDHDGISTLERCVNNFATHFYFYSKDTNTTFLDTSRFVNKKILHVGDFHVYEMKKSGGK